MCDKFQPLCAYRGASKGKTGMKNKDGPASGLRYNSTTKSAPSSSNSKEMESNDKMLLNCLNYDCKEKHCIKNLPNHPRRNEKIGN